MAGNAVIGALRVNLGLDSAQFSTGLKNAQVETGKFGAALKTAFAAVAVAAAGALAGVAATIKGNIDSFDEMSKSASKMGIPIEELSKLKYAADLSGVSMEGLQTAVGRLSRNIVDAAKGTGDGTKAFRALGISVKDSDGKVKSSSKILSELADRFATLPDGAEKTAIAMRLMGRSGADMIPLLNGGSSALNELLAEAKSFGLEISADTGRAAEAFNDNLSRIGYAIQGASVGLSAALAPALAIASEGMVKFVQAALDGMQYLPKIAEYAAVAGGSLAVLFSPVILSGIYSVTVAIGVGMVGAVRALGLAIAANPLGALAIAIAVAVTAAYHFRDEIKQAVGVDVVDVVKQVGNKIIGVFVGAYNAVTAAWGNLPAFFSAIGKKAWNSFIAEFEKPALTINGMTIIPGLDLSALKADVTEMDESVLKPAVAKFTEATNTDYIGNMGAIISGARSAADATNSLSTAINGTGAAMRGLDDEGGGKKEKDPYKKIIDGANRRLASMDAERQSIGMTDEASAALRYETELLNQAQQKGITLTAGQKTELAGLAQQMASTEVGTKKLGDAFDFAKDSTKGFLSDFRQGLMNGESVWKSFGSAALNVLNKIIDKIETQFVDAIFSMNSGLGGAKGGSSAGGIFGSLIGGIGKLFGFARGGTIMPGGGGGMDSQLVAFRKSPNERVDITKPGQTLTAGRSGGGDRRIVVNVNGARGNQEIQQMVSAGVTHGLSEYDKNLPGRMSDITERNG